MCSREHWREQFRCSSFGLEYPQPRRFTRFEWGWPKVYLCWRGVVAAYHVAMILYSGLTDDVTWFIYLTNWAFFTLTLGTVVEVIAVGYCYVKRQDIIKGEVHRMPLFLKVIWVWQNLINTVSVLVTAMFWGLLYSPEKNISNVSYIAHAGNTVYVIINLCITASPVRFLHFVHPFFMVFTFLVFSALYQVAGGTNHLGESTIYPVLDWQGNTVRAIFAAFACSCIAVPFIQFVILLIAMLRGTLFDSCLGRSRRSSAHVIGVDNGIDLT